LTIGATTTHRTIEKSSLIKEKYRVLSDMETKLASIQVRNWGTIGGNVCHADAAGDPAPVLMTLGASVKLGSSSGTRVVPLDEFYVDLFETSLKEDELLLENPGSQPVTRSVKKSTSRADQGIIAVAPR
jgi:carbon-monoxide dehydrogenase medium subunit